MKMETDDGDARHGDGRERRPTERRERTLEIIRDHPDSMSVSELARALLGKKGGDDCAASRRVAVYLHHVDLPKLRDQGEIEYYQSLGLVV